MTERDVPSSNDPDIDKLIEDITTHSTMDDAEIDMVMSAEEQLREQELQRSVSQYFLDHGLMTPEILARGLDPHVVLMRAHYGETSPLTDVESAAYTDYLIIYTGAYNVASAKMIYGVDSAYEAIVDDVRELVGRIEAASYTVPERKERLLKAVYEVVAPLAPELPSAEIAHIIEQGGILSDLHKIEEERQRRKKVIRQTAIERVQGTFEALYGHHDDSGAIVRKLVYSAELDKYGPQNNPHIEEVGNILAKYPELSSVYALIVSFYQAEDDIA
jgi:hypothetical protein